MQLTRNDIRIKLKNIMRGMYDSAPAVLESATDDTRLMEDLGLNSVGLLYMVVIIEESFQIRFDQVGGNQFQTVGDVVSYIEKQQA